MAFKSRKAIRRKGAPGFEGFTRAFQSKMVRVLFDDPDFTITTGVRLAPEHFENRIHRWFAGSIIGYAQKHGAGIPKDALEIELNRAVKIGRLQKADLPDAQAFMKRVGKPVSERTFIKEQLHKFIKHRAIFKAFSEGLEHFEKQDYDAVDGVFSQALEVQETLGEGLGSFYVRDVASRTKKRKKFVRDGIATGIAQLDDRSKYGGVRRGQLACVVAPSGKGKSWCLVHFGKSAIIESNAKVLHITLELSEEDVLDRYDTAFSGVPIGDLEGKPNKIKKAVRDIGRKYGEALVVKGFPPGTITAPAIRAHMRQLEAHGFYPDVVIVDYADEMIPTRMGREADAYEDMGRIYLELRKLAVEANVVVWTASQTNKGALTKENFDWNDIADSAKKVHRSDLILMFMQTPEEKKKMSGRIGVSKSRIGPDKYTIPVRVDWAHAQLRSK